MDGISNKMSEKVICCFCGEYLPIKNAAVIIVQPSVESQETQQLFCHKKHLIERINKSVPLHPDFFDDDDAE